MILKHLSARNFVALVTLISMTVLVFWIMQRYRREVRRDLQNRGLVPSSHRRRRHSSSTSSAPEKTQSHSGRKRSRVAPRAQHPSSRSHLMDNCSAITKKSASNLALAFFLLPKAKRDAMGCSICLLPRGR